MLRSMNSPPDAHDDHLRHLLDQRTARADLHARFPSLSEISDTPSIYSRAFFSPRPMEKAEVGSSLNTRLRSPPQGSGTLDLRSNRERLNDPTASMLDLDDDPRTSFSSSDVYNDDERFQESMEDEEEPMPRMSLLGPKMRFHSRAPWEMDEGTLEEGDESDNSANYISAVASSARGRIKDGGIKKRGFASPGSRTSDVSRPSGESSRSQGNSKRSFETTSSQASNPRGALHALAQASVSSISLLPTSSSGQSPLRSQFSTGRMLPETPITIHTPSPHPSPPGATNPCSSNNGNPCPKDTSQLLTRTNTHTSSFTQSSSSYSHEQEDDVHPYANPDLVISYARDPPPFSPLRSTFTFPEVVRSDSSVTVTDSLATTLSKSSTQTTLTPDTSITSAAREQSRSSAFQGKEISSPSLVHRPVDVSSPRYDYRDTKAMPHLPPHPGASNIAGWAERGASPTFALISLEEARAQRSRSSTAHTSLSHPSGSNTASVQVIPTPEADEDTAGVVNSFDYSPNGSVASRARARSISAGARAKHALHSMVGGTSLPKMERRDSEPAVVVNGVAPGKGLKHKKSGFLRLFNGREKDKEAPPVPSLSDAYVAYNAQNPVQKSSKTTQHRIPVPSLSPSLLESAEGGGSPRDQYFNSSKDIHDGGLEPSHTSTSLKPSNSPKRTPPPLSINTASQASVPRAPASAAGGSSFQTRMAPSSIASDRSWSHLDTMPQSAPANVSEFPALKLRPVSTMFSAHFGDHIVARDSRPSLEADLGTLSPASASAMTSPVTPAVFLHSDRSSSDKPPMMSISEDQPSVIQTLQDQIVSAKQAWQRQIWELEGQVRDLKAEVEDLRAAENAKDYCDVCGRGNKPAVSDLDHQYHNGLQDSQMGGVVNRPRARTGTSARFGSAV